MKRWKVVVLIILFCAVTAFAARSIFLPVVEIPGETEYLPGEVVTIRKDTLETVQALAAERLTTSKLKLIEGELRDEVGRLYKVVELLSIDTGPVETPEPEVITKIIKQACADEIVPLGRARLVGATKFEGLDEETGEMARGWVGKIRCEMATYRDATWGLLVEEPFTLTNTSAVEIEQPGPARPFKRRYAGLHWAAVVDGRSFDLDYKSVVFNPTRVRVYGGYRWWPDRKFSLKTGVFADSQSIGGDVGVDW